MLLQHQFRNASLVPRQLQCKSTDGNSVPMHAHPAHSRRTSLLLFQSIAMTGSVTGGCTEPAFAAPLFTQQPGIRELLDPGPGNAIISNPGVSWTLNKRAKQLKYPDWLSGTWEVHASFVDAGFPLGKRFINREVPGFTKGSMIVALADVGAAMERPLVYQSRFLYSAEEGGVVADRPFNIKQQADALLGYAAVQSVNYEPLDNPTRLNVVWTTPRRSGSSDPLDQRNPQQSDLRKAEIFINNREAEPESGQPSSPKAWCGSELYRQVSQAARQGAVGDYMTLTCYEREAVLGDGNVLSEEGAASVVSARMRVAAFLQPQDPLFFESGGKAVAIYDYALRLQRKLT
ncbi:hypothetical protein DUNSADRAFT_16755 [Dunaliella salina]|uniref:DUF6816 domain-containing protein n=1 Tax=Dunaliella salina TaxID=3046 RepID=A0ABQ7G303_DUNSA|nr:hypothetical protein DUNSADRAFT_16755 [Dunaliella salina]|eukprot:KAF5828958.1 hypothetical protein DUNSADRAFT_16755 [Dunaliella salina]